MSSPLQKSTAWSVATVFLVAMCLAGCSEVGQFARDAYDELSRGEERQEIKAKVLLDDDRFAVAAGSSRVLSVTLSVEMESPRLIGSFRAYGGLGNDILVYVFDDENYINWRNGHNAGHLYYSGRVTTGSFELPLLEDGTYHIVYCNIISITASKEVDTTVTLEYLQGE
jgi:hypothetical protein